MHPSAPGPAVQPTSAAPSAVAGLLAAGPAFAGGGGMLGSVAGAVAGDRQDPALHRAPQFHEGSTGGAAWRNYSKSWFAPTMGDAKAVRLLPYGHPSGALGWLYPSHENP